ncbi:DNA repair protein RecN (Recombination protein N) [Parelusimicrobium proximum]|uniref:DNA repair protein RecN n=1 Tax=Parelusimicrobium proximum TaxID=3228953 RepID=UPI003D16C849
MLETLHLKDFAIITELKLSFSEGFNVFSGETGAGKSIIIEGLSFVLGDRGDATMIRDGADKMSAEAEFASSALSAHSLKQYNISSRTFFIKREFDLKGKSKAWINAIPVAVGKLAEIGGELIDFHGQHEHQTLIKSSVQLGLLDKYASDAKELKETEKIYKEYKDAQDKLAAVRMSKEERERMLEIYRFQLKEIEDADVKEGEDAEIEAALPKLKHAGKLRELAADAHSLIEDGEYNAVEALSKALKEVGDMAELDGSLAKVAEDFSAALNGVQAAAEFLAQYRDNIDVSPEELDDMLSRQQKISKLKIKYGPEIKDILDKESTLAEQIANLENNDEKEAELVKKVSELKASLLSAAEKLSAVRSAAAVKMSKEMIREITPLGFKDIKFKTDVMFDEDNINARGGDKVEFLFSPNPGQSLRPLKNIASGGEMSRVMLGLKAVLSPDVPTAIFDEIDAGIGGETGIKVGEKLKKVSEGRQVLCVTHLAQVAVYADKQFTVSKRSDKRSTTVMVDSVEGEKRTEEIARMLGGSAERGSAAYMHARELLEAASKSRK